MAKLDIFNRKKEQVDPIREAEKPLAVEIPAENVAPEEAPPSIVDFPVESQSHPESIEDDDAEDGDDGEEENIDSVDESSQPPMHESVNGWNPIETAVHNGMPCLLSVDPEGLGVLGFWKKTRAFANATKRYEPYGKWVDFQTGMDIAFEPQYWKDRYAV